MVYSPEQVKQLAADYKLWRGRESALTTALAVHPYRLAASHVMATHGVLRRLSTMLHCMRRIYEALPPDQSEPPRLSMHDAEAYLQAFIINAYGVLDNLARIWCTEIDLKTDKGKALPNSYIGLGPDKKLVRASFSEGFRQQLAASDAWFGYLENYRHALAHRIPLYIPPRTLDDAAQTEWHRLEQEMLGASKELRHDDYGRLSAEQKNLGVFQGLMQHSYGDAEWDGTPVQFHGQVICDLATVVEIGDGIVKELKALDVPSAPHEAANGGASDDAP
jgi:hypothetical protein